MKALLIGSTGLIGKHCLDFLIHDENYTQVEVWVRNPNSFPNQKFTEKIMQFEDIPGLPLIQADHLFCYLGTTMRKAKTQDAFRKVDVEYVVSLAKLAERSGIHTFLVISSVGANPVSGNFYLRTKGEMEEAVKQCSIPSIYILRPSMLLGKRPEQRFGESIGKIISKIFSPFLFSGLRKYRAIQAETVARAMIACAESSQPGIHVLESDEIERAGGRVNR
ncbi:MAG: NAD(P)H-binding protein [bacterium]